VNSLPNSSQTRAANRRVFLATLLLLGLAAVTLANAAQALPAVQISGSAPPAAVHGPATLVFTYKITAPVAIESTSLTTHQANGAESSQNRDLESSAILRIHRGVGFWLWLRYSWSFGQVSRPSVITIGSGRSMIV
jgi:hypothetical protein